MSLCFEIFERHFSKQKLIQDSTGGVWDDGDNFRILDTCTLVFDMMCDISGLKVIRFSDKSLKHMLQGVVIVISM